jgi:hypothetical protein
MRRYLTGAPLGKFGGDTGCDVCMAKLSVSLFSYVPIQGCTCDNQLLNLLPMVGASSAQINFGKPS